MKFKPLLLLFFCVSLASFSQSAKEQKLMDKLCSQACTAFENAGIADTDTEEELQMKMSIALMPVITENTKEIKSVMGLDMSDPNDMRQIAEKLGMALALKCKKMQEIAMKVAMKQANGSSNTDGNETKPAEKSKSAVSGTIQKIDCADLCVVYFKTDADETIRLYWMEKFTGSEKLEKFADADKSKTFKFTYKEMEIYQPKSKSYQTVKVITEIE